MTRSTRMRRLGALLLVAAAPLAAQTVPAPAPAPAPAAALPTVHASVNPFAPLALSFFGDVEVRTVPLQSAGIGIGYLNADDRNAFFSIDAKYRFWLGDRDFEGWAIAPTVGIVRVTDDLGDRIERGTRGSFGLQFDYTWRVARGRMTVTSGAGAKRLFGGSNETIDVNFLPTFRLSIGALF